MASIRRSFSTSERGARPRVLTQTDACLFGDIDSLLTCDVNKSTEELDD